ncbi:MAG: molybdenum cofactor guanylyltransferase [Candidatus Sulfotelmatobacter sp.]
MDDRCVDDCCMNDRLHAPADDLTVFVLAGGKSTRMGRDKAFLDYDGVTLLAHALEVVQSVVTDVRIVGSREKFAVFAPVVEDIFPDCGPLGGIHAALRASPTELIVIIAVDMPFVSESFLKYLIGRAREASDAVVVVPRSEGRRQPLCAIYRREFADTAEAALRAGRYRIDALFEVVPCLTITEQELEAAGFSVAIFCNLNTREDLVMSQFEFPRY